MAVVSETIEGSALSKRFKAESRQAILTFILQRLQQEGELCSQVLTQIKTHGIAPDELTEAGLSYEDVCAIDHALAIAKQKTS